MTFDWQATYARAIHHFGDTPGAQLEADLHEQFKLHPQAVTNAITKIIDAYKAGRIRSPWGALKSEVAKQIDREAIVDSKLEDRSTVQRAEQWIRNTGLHYDRFSEVEDELMRREKFAPIATPEVMERMLAIWVEVRPAGVQVELEHEERLANWKRQTDELERQPKPQADAA